MIAEILSFVAGGICVGAGFVAARGHRPLPHTSCRIDANTLRKERDEAREEATALRRERDCAFVWINSVRLAVSKVPVAGPQAAKETREPVQ